MKKPAMVLLAALFFAATPSAGTLATDNTRDALQPFGPWRVDSSQAECRLMREFGAGSNSLTFLLTQGAGPSRYDAVLAGTVIPKLPKSLPLDLQLFPQGTSQTVDVNSTLISKRGGRLGVVSWSDADASFLNNLEVAQHLSVSGGGDFAASIDLRGVRSAIAALRTCQDGLLRIWGVAHEVSKTLKDLPKPVVAVGGGNPGFVIAQRADLPEQPIVQGSWVSFLDYPNEALRQEVSGAVVMALSLNPTGHVENCRVVVSSKFEPLDRRSCKVLTERARYTPARSANGDAVPSTVIERIRWTIP